MRKQMMVAVLILVSLLGGCRSAARENVTPIALTNTIATFPAKITIAPTASLTASVTIVPTASETPEPLTATSLPTISASKAKEIMARFVQENGGCQLPCVMGLTPGLSDQKASIAFVNFFQDYAREANNQIDDINIWSYIENNQGGMSLRFFDNKKSVRISLGYIFDGKRVNQILFGGEAYLFLEGGDAKEQFGIPYFDNLLSTFTLPQILNTYGVPSQILVWPFPSPPAVFDFVLFYPEKGFLIEYISERTEQESYYVGCPTKPYSLHLSTWNPNTPLTLLEAVQYFSNADGVSDQNTEAFKPIEDVTALTIKDFYEIYKNPNSGACVQTPKELWPLSQ